MPVERRGWVIAFEIGSPGNGRNPIFNGRRQPSCGGTSRMTRECQVRICERLGVKFPGPTRPVKYVRAVAHPSTGEDPESVVFVGAITDITEHKRTEEERERLRQLEADLARMNRVS